MKKFLICTGEWDYKPIYSPCCLHSLALSTGLCDNLNPIFKCVKCGNEFSIRDIRK